MTIWFPLKKDTQSLFTENPFPVENANSFEQEEIGSVKQK